MKVEIIKKGPGGRPTKFKPAYVQALIKFFDIEPYKQIVTEKTTENFKDGSLKKESYKFRQIPNKLPTLYSFARKIGVDYSQLWQWAHKGEEQELEKIIDTQMRGGKTETEAFEIAQGIKQFHKAYKEAKELQKEFLITIGLAGAAPAPFAIFTAKNITDMRDTSVVTHNLPKPILDNVQSDNSNKKDFILEEKN